MIQMLKKIIFSKQLKKKTVSLNGLTKREN